MNQDWTQDPALKGIDPAKLAMLQTFMTQGKQKSPMDLLPFLNQAAKTSQNKGLQFQPNEIETILEVLRQMKSPKEIAKMERMMSLLRMLTKS